MARLDVHRMPGADGYLLDVQADLLAGLEKRVVIPLLPPDVAPKPIQHLNPVVEIAGVPHLLFTQGLGVVPVQDLRRPVASLAGEHDAVTRALDLLLTGF